MKAGLENLEARIAFQEDAIEKLSTVVARQSKELEEIQRQFLAVYSKLAEVNVAMESMGEGSFSPSQDEPPPHY